MLFVPHQFDAVAGAHIPFYHQLARVDLQVTLLAQSYQVVPLVFVKAVVDASGNLVSQALLDNVVCVQWHMLFRHWSILTYGTLFVPMRAVVS